MLYKEKRRTKNWKQCKNFRTFTKLLLWTTKRGVRRWGWITNTALLPPSLSVASSPALSSAQSYICEVYQLLGRANGEKRVLSRQAWMVGYGKSNNSCFSLKMASNGRLTRRKNERTQHPSGRNGFFAPWVVTGFAWCLCGFIASIIWKPNLTWLNAVTWSPSGKTVPGRSLRSLGCRRGSSLTMSAEAAAKLVVAWMWTNMFDTLRGWGRMGARNFQLGASSPDHPEAWTSGRSCFLSAPLSGTYMTKLMLIRIICKDIHGFQTRQSHGVKWYQLRSGICMALSA